MILINFNHFIVNNVRENKKCYHEEKCKYHKPKVRPPFLHSFWLLLVFLETKSVQYQTKSFKTLKKINITLMNFFLKIK